MAPIPPMKASRRVPNPIPGPLIAKSPGSPTSRPRPTDSTPAVPTSNPFRPTPRIVPRGRRAAPPIIAPAIDTQMAPPLRLDCADGDRCPQCGHIVAITATVPRQTTQTAIAEDDGEFTVPRGGDGGIGRLNRRPRHWQAAAPGATPPWHDGHAYH